MRDSDERRHGLPFLAGVCTGVLAIWPVLSFVSLPSGDPLEQIRAVASFPWAYALNFIVALVIAPLLVTVLISFYRERAREGVMRGDVDHVEAAALAKGKDPTTGGGVRIGYGLYIILASLSYGSQVILSIFGPWQLRPGDALTWFFYNQQSVPYVINQTGYLIWGITTLLLFAPLLRKRGFVRWIALLLVLSAALQIVATLGLYAGLSVLTQLTTLSGLLLLPVTIMLIFYGLRVERLRER
jgi:hypothetical protein